MFQFQNLIRFQAARSLETMKAIMGGRSGAFAHLGQAGRLMRDLDLFQVGYRFRHTSATKLFRQSSNL